MDDTMRGSETPIPPPRMNPELIQGGVFEDHRGRLEYINDFDLSPIKRLNFTTNADTETIRAWQGHIIEHRWFHCVRGSFKVKLVSIDDSEAPSPDCPITEYHLSADNPLALHIPNGFLNGFQALEDGSKLMILSDYQLGANPDDHTAPLPRPR